MAKIDKIELENKTVYFIFSKNEKKASYIEKSPLLISGRGHHLKKIWFKSQRKKKFIFNVS